LIGRLRIAGWSLVAAMLALPAVAMQFTSEVDWTTTDFAVFGAMLLIAGGLIELAARARNVAYLFAAALAVGAGFLTVWAALAVGINGEGASDLMYAGVLALPLVGGALMRFRAAGLAMVLSLTALAQAGLTAWAFTAGLIPAAESVPVGGASAVLVLLYLASAMLFRRAAKEQAAG
jgi:hypothetical protein